MRKLFLILLLVACSRKGVSEPQNPSISYDAFQFYGIKPNTKLVYLYNDSSFYKYSFFITTIIPPNPDTLTRQFFDTTNLSIVYRDSLWSFLNPPLITFDTIRILNDGIIFKKFIDILQKNHPLTKKYPYPLTQTWTPFQASVKPILDSTKIGNLTFSCSLLIYIDTIYVDSSKGFSSQLDDTTYILITKLFSRIKYRYKFDKIVLNQGLVCNESDTILKQDYALKYILDSVRLVKNKGIVYMSKFDTLYAKIQHHTNNANSNIETLKKIKLYFIK